MELVMLINRHPKQIDARRQAETFYQFVDCVTMPRIHELLRNPFGGSQSCR